MQMRDQIRIPDIMSELCFDHSFVINLLLVNIYGPFNGSVKTASRLINITTSRLFGATALRKPMLACEVEQRMQLNNNLSMFYS